MIMHVVDIQLLLFYVASGFCFHDLYIVVYMALEYLNHAVLCICINNTLSTMLPVISGVPY